LNVPSQYAPKLVVIAALASKETFGGFALCHDVLGLIVSK
jgi:hypothetical protein